MPTMASMIVFFALMTNGTNGDGMTVIDFKKRYIARMTKWDQEFSPTRIFLEQRLSAREWRVSQQIKRAFNGRKRSFGGIQIPLDKKVVQAIEILESLRR
jgi:hypothetical protein